MGPGSPEESLNSWGQNTHYIDVGARKGANATSAVGEVARWHKGSGCTEAGSRHLEQGTEELSQTLDHADMYSGT